MNGLHAIAGKPITGPVNRDREPLTPGIDSRQTAIGSQPKGACMILSNYFDVVAGRPSWTVYRLISLSSLNLKRLAVGAEPGVTEPVSRDCQDRCVNAQLEPVQLSVLQEENILSTSYPQPALRILRIGC